MDAIILGTYCCDPPRVVERRAACNPFPPRDSPRQSSLTCRGLVYLQMLCEANPRNSDGPWLRKGLDWLTLLYWLAVGCYFILWIRYTTLIGSALFQKCSKYNPVTTLTCKFKAVLLCMSILLMYGNREAIKLLDWVLKVKLLGWHVWITFMKWLPC